MKNKKEIVILFSPSENKILGGKTGKNILSFDIERKYIILEYLSNIYYKKKWYEISEIEIENMKKLFSTKKVEKVKEIRENILTQKENVIKAIERYSGVAFKYLDYLSLDQKSQKYIDENTIIFSNLLGPILAKDKISFYKLKQGMKLSELNIENYYKKNSTELLNNFIKDKLVVDLRANHYKKFFKLKDNHITIKFYKNDKIVTHYSKVYRGIILRELAKNNIKSENELENLKISELTLRKVEEYSTNKEYIYDINLF